MGRWRTEVQCENPNPTRLFRRPFRTLVGDHPTLRARNSQSPCPGVPSSILILESAAPSISDQIPRQNYGARAASMTHCTYPVPHHCPHPATDSSTRSTKSRTHQGQVHCLPSTEGMDDSSPRIRSVPRDLARDPRTPRYHPKAAAAPKTSVARAQRRQCMGALRARHSSSHPIPESWRMRRHCVIQPGFRRPSTATIPPGTRQVVFSIPRPCAEEIQSANRPPGDGTSPPTVDSVQKTLVPRVLVRFPRPLSRACPVSRTY